MAIVITYSINSILNLSLVMRKPVFCICENKDADQLRGNSEADQLFVFATWIVQSLFYLNPKFQASGYLLWFYSLVCVGPGRKPRRPVFSQRGSFLKIFPEAVIIRFVVLEYTTRRGCFLHWSKTCFYEQCLMV